jgi:hypothetical protein
VVDTIITQIAIFTRKIRITIVVHCLCTHQTHHNSMVHLHYYLTSPDLAVTAFNCLSIRKRSFTHSRWEVGSGRLRSVLRKFSRNRPNLENLGLELDEQHAKFGLLAEEGDLDQDG